MLASHRITPRFLNEYPSNNLHTLPYMETACQKECDTEENSGALIRSIEPIAAINYCHC